MKVYFICYYQANAVLHKFTSSFVFVWFLVLFNVFNLLQAAAANKRLKEALARQKAVLNERNAKMETCDSTSIGNRVRVSCHVLYPLSFFLSVVI